MFKIPFFLTKSEIYWWKWLNNFATKLAKYYVQFGITKETFDEVVARAKALDFVMTVMFLNKNGATAWVEIKEWLLGRTKNTGQVKYKQPFAFPDPVPAEVMPNVMELPVLIGLSIVNSTYATPDILKDLGLVPPGESGIEVPEDDRAPKKDVVKNAPLLKAKVEGDVITLRIIRGEIFSGTNACIFANKEGTSTMTLMDTTNQSKKVDKAVFPKGVDRVVYAYQVQCKNGDTLVGDPSEILLVVVKRPLGLA